MLERSHGTTGTAPKWRPVQVASPGLNPQELAEAEQVARRLHEELRTVVTLLPEPQRGASAMSRTLGVDRATCQRIVAAASQANAGVEILSQVPGVQGLRQFVTAMGARPDRKANAEALASAAAAIDRFEGLLSRLGGSQRQLKARLGLDGRQGDPHPTQGGADDPASREALFRAAAAVTGRFCSTLLDVRVIRPVSGKPSLTEGLRIRGMLGHVARPDAVPLEVAGSAPLRADPVGPAFETLGHTPASGNTPGSLLAPFCSQPLPRVTSRAAGYRVAHVIDTATTSGDKPGDIVIAHRGAQPDRHPATLTPPLGEMWFLMTFPARRMVFDVFLHREIARRCIPSIELHLWGPDVGRHGASRWSTRFPANPRLELLGSGLSGVSTPAYSRHPDLLRHVFQQVEWPEDEFVGYRCEVSYPVWRAGYCMAFDFTGNEIPHDETPAT